MATGGLSLRKIGFLTPGNYSDDNPGDGIEKTLKLIEFGETLGFDTAWVRQRHLEHGISSAAVFLAAASQRTEAIDLGVAVIPLGYESPFRLAEDLATVDVLSRGRLKAGLSTGKPPHYQLIGDRVHDGDPSSIDFTHDRVLKLKENLASRPIGGEDSFIDTPFGRQQPRLQPHARGLADRLWYGGGSLRSAEWAGRNGFNLLLSNVTTGEGTDDFHEAQLNQLRLYRKSGGEGRPVEVGRVIVPTDGADKARGEKYAAYKAARFPRTLQPNGDRRTLFPVDLVGSSEEIIEALSNDPVLAEVDELRLDLPYEFEEDEYIQILSDFRNRIAPALGYSGEHGERLRRLSNG